MSLLNLIFNRKKYKKPAKLSVSNVKGFLQGEIRSFLADMDVLLPDSHIKEQAIWRLHEISEKSPQCIKNGECDVCGCDLTKVYEDRGCAADFPCYPAMRTKEEWEKFKKENNIEVQ